MGTQASEGSAVDVDWCIFAGWGEVNEEPHILLIDSGSKKCCGKARDVSEVYPPPRVTVMARKMGLSGGWALDLTTGGDQGEPLDFGRREHRRKVKELARKSKPLLLVGSPERRWFSALQNHRDPEAAAEAFGKAIEHMEFVCQLYEMQVARGDIFFMNTPRVHQAGKRKWLEA